MERSKRWGVDLYRNRITIIALFAVCISCSSGGEDRTVGTDMVEIPASLEGDSDAATAKIEFEETEFSTGRIVQGEKVAYIYKFKNTGSGPLIISNVSGSCGCTIPKNYPRGKILPGETGEIEVFFDSDNKMGQMDVAITVASNSVPQAPTLLIHTDIVAPNQTPNKP